MTENKEGCVGLFIDWDNLAISIAADLDGAAPDVKRIVQTAQQYGTVLISRAYAEWTVTSDRLGVYRAGVEPVYAPTFRYDTDPVTQAPRGKSLADPIMVADCVDMLHLLPQITTFVIVSGDKDLIPVVRLAQLRGKHVVVIGPDYAAGVLREVADEFISYRKVVDAEDFRASPAELVPDIRSGRRRGVGRATSVPTMEPRRATSHRAQGSAPAPLASKPLAPPRPAAVAPSVEPPVESSPLPVSPSPRTPSPIENGARAEAVDQKAPTADIQTVFELVQDIVRQRTSEAKPKMRATNLKDALMSRLPNFTERKYGFSKFKDFLVAAERNGIVSVSAAGPVHWVSPVQRKEEVPPVESGAAQPGEEVATLPQALEDRQADILRFIIDLRGRSRWLTYTYVLTNLITFLSKTMPQGEAEAEARSTLNALVQQGVLCIDREPQEVEVGGLRHRVRLCHVVEEHPVVTDMLASAEAVLPLEPEPDVASAAEMLPAEPEQSVVIMPELDDLSATITLESHPAGRKPGRPDAAEWPTPRFEADEMGLVAEPPVQVEDLAPAAEEPSEVEPEPATVAFQASTVGEGASLDSPIDDVAELDVAGLAAVGSASPTAGSGKVSKVVSSTTTLDDAFVALTKVVTDSVTPEQPKMKIAGLKAKLNGLLGHFDEQQYGFGRFKDFLLAADRAGYVVVETVGPATWVAPRNGREQHPGESNPEAVAQESDSKQKRGRRSPRKPGPASAS
ncbi:MAG: NYN domain-containing protein [Chloroflexi bacterium]|nr:NYN domain-containing protein [Chloroflexota bacterium]